MSAHVTNGSETTQLEILWLRSSDNFFVVLHTIKSELQTFSGGVVVWSASTQADREHIMYPFCL